MKKVLLFFGIILSVLSVNAEDNVLQTIEIVPVKDTYNIVLVSDKSVDVKKTVQAPNKITLEMKGIRASKTLNTVYNNVSNVDTVMVEPKGNGISLFFQAENAADASVSFDALVPATNTKTSQQLKLSSPIETYAPIYREEMNQPKTSPFIEKITAKSNSIKEDIRENAGDAAGTLNKVFSFGLIGLLAFSVVKLFKRKDTDMQIGLTQSLNDREVNMYKNAQPIGVASMSQEKPFTTVNYGVNAYKRETQNPYETEPLPIHNPRLRKYNTLNQTVSAPQTRSINQTVATMPNYQAVPKVQQTAMDMSSNTQTNPNIDNLKFLESMTAIYEKSGRHDLAQGLKASLSKSAKV